MVKRKFLETAACFNSLNFPFKSYPIQHAHRSLKGLNLRVHSCPVDAPQRENRIRPLCSCQTLLTFSDAALSLSSQWIALLSDCWTAVEGIWISTKSLPTPFGSETGKVLTFNMFDFKPSKLPFMLAVLYTCHLCSPSGRPTRRLGKADPTWSAETEILKAPHVWHRLVVFGTNTLQLKCQDHPETPEACTQSIMINLRWSQMKTTSWSFFDASCVSSESIYVSKYLQPKRNATVNAAKHLDAERNCWWNQFRSLNPLKRFSILFKRHHCFLVSLCDCCSNCFENCRIQSVILS